MNIGRDAERSINQILSNVQGQSDMQGQSSSPQVDSASGWSDSWSNMEGTSQASTEDTGWYTDKRGTPSGEEARGQYQNPLPSGGPPGFGRPPEFGDIADAPSTSQPLLMGGVAVPETTPTSICSIGGATSAKDKKLRDDLLESRDTNSRYKKMMVNPFL